MNTCKKSKKQNSGRPVDNLLLFVLKVLQQGFVSNSPYMFVKPFIAEQIHLSKFKALRA